MQLLNELERWLTETLPEVAADLNPCADAQTLEALQAMLPGASLPPAFLSLYRWHDGQKMAANSGPWYGLSFLPLDQVMRELKSWRDVAESFSPLEWAEMNSGMSSTPRGYIKCEYSNPRWVPFACDWGGNYLGIDLDPDALGTPGQVINFGRDEARKIAVAPDLDTFLAWMLTELKAGNVNIREEEDGGRSFNTLRPEKYHFLDSLAVMFPAK